MKRKQTEGGEAPPRAKREKTGSSSDAADKKSIVTDFFDPCSVQASKLLDVAKQVFIESGCVAKCKVDEAKLTNFLAEVKNRHRDKNAYHNWFHAFHVLFNTYRFIQQSIDLFPPASVLGLLVAAVCHDLDHCGISNAQLVAKKDPLAVRFENKSPLEQHSLQLTFELLNKDSCNVLSGLDQKENARVRELIQAIILATDISDPSNVKRVHEEWAKHAARFRANNYAHQCTLARMTVLCADIGIVQEQFATFIAWVRRLFDENRACDSALSVDTFYAGQLKFLDAYATPLFHSVSDSSLLDGFGAVRERFDDNKSRMKERNHIADALNHAGAAAGAGAAASSSAASATSSASSASSSSSAAASAAPSLSATAATVASSTPNSNGSHGSNGMDCDDGTLALPDGAAGSSERKTAKPKKQSKRSS